MKYVTFDEEHGGKIKFIHNRVYWIVFSLGAFQSCLAIPPMCFGDPVKLAISAPLLICGLHAIGFSACKANVVAILTLVLSFHVLAVEVLLIAFVTVRSGVDDSYKLASLVCNCSSWAFGSLAVIVITYIQRRRKGLQASFLPSAQVQSPREVQSPPSDQPTAASNKVVLYSPSNLVQLLEEERRRNRLGACVLFVLGWCFPYAWFTSWVYVFHEDMITSAWAKLSVTFSFILVLSLIVFGYLSSEEGVTVEFSIVFP
mmetsp:Transcript_4745/g.8141  ORF Transcript_4745/g.8141 Transcript_4745/m.8141 type:complete len:258 (+) Transcript_4745:41-814(+)